MKALSCGKYYVGQTGWCVNEILREHSSSLRATPSGNVAIHCSRCGCTPCFNYVILLARKGGRVGMEIIEAHHIRKSGEEGCVSTASLALSDIEIVYLPGQ